jgi:LPS export ABC transporter protein LptC
MKRIQLTLSLIILAAATGAGVWMYLEARGPSSDTPVTGMLAEDVDLLMKGDVLISEHNQGRLSLEVSGRDLSYAQDMSQINLDQPKIWLWPQDGGSYYIQGESGVYLLDPPELELRGRIQGVSEQGYLLQTDWLRYLPDESRAETDAEVVVSRQEFRLAGTGMRFDLDGRGFEVLSRARLVVSHLNPGKR